MLQKKSLGMHGTYRNIFKNNRKIIPTGYLLNTIYLSKGYRKEEELSYFDFEQN